MNENKARSHVESLLRPSELEEYRKLAAEFVEAKKVKDEAITAFNAVKSEHNNLASSRRLLVSELQEQKAHYTKLSEEVRSLQGAVNLAKKKRESRKEIVKKLVPETEEPVAFIREQLRGLKLRRDSLMSQDEPKGNIMQRIRQTEAALEIASKLDQETVPPSDLREKSAELQTLSEARKALNSRLNKVTKDLKEVSARYDECRERLQAARDVADRIRARIDLLLSVKKETVAKPASKRRVVHEELEDLQKSLWYASLDPYEDKVSEIEIMRSRVEHWEAENKNNKEISMSFDFLELLRTLEVPISNDFQEILKLSRAAINEKARKMEESSAQYKESRLRVIAFINAKIDNLIKKLKLDPHDVHESYQGVANTLMVGGS